MAKYRIDGQVYEADSPDVAYAMAEQAAKVADYADDPWTTKIQRGVAQPLIEGYIGGKQLLGLGDEMDEKVLAESRAGREGAGGWGTVGEIGSFLLPGGAVAKGATKVASMLPRASGALSRAGTAIAPQVVGQAGLESAYQGLRGQEEGDPTREERMIEGAKTGATGALVGEVGARALPRAWKAMARPSGIKPEALKLERAMRETGVSDLRPGGGLTAGQLVDDSTGFGSAVSGVEETLQRMPGAKNLLQARQRAVGDWNLTEMRKALPVDLRPKVKEAGPVGMDQMRTAVGDAYTSALKPLEGAPLQLTDQVIDDLARIEQRFIPRVSQASRNTVQQDLDNLLQDIAEGRLSSEGIKQMETGLGKKAWAMGNNGAIEEAKAYKSMLGALRDARDEAIGPESAVRVHELDNAYEMIATLRDAAGFMGAIKEGVFSPSHLLRAGTRGQSKWNKAKAGSKGAKRALAAEQVFGDTIPKVGPGTAEKLAAQAAIGGITGTGAGILSGQDPLEAAQTSGLAGALGVPAAARLLPRLRKPIVGRTKAQQKMRRAQPKIDKIKRGSLPLTMGYIRTEDQE